MDGANGAPGFIKGTNPLKNDLFVNTQWKDSKDDTLVMITVQEIFPIYVGSDATHSSLFNYDTVLTFATLDNGYNIFQQMVVAAAGLRVRILNTAMVVNIICWNPTGQVIKSVFLPRILAGSKRVPIARAATAIQAIRVLILPLTNVFASARAFSPVL